MISFTSTLPNDINILTEFELQHPYQLRWGLEVKEENYQNERAKYIWMLRDNDIIGEVILGWVSNIVVEVDSFTILPKYRGYGFGKLILEESIKWSKEHGFKFMRAAARQGASIRSFLSLGAEITEVKYNWGDTGENYIGVQIKL